VRIKEARLKDFSAFKTTAFEFSSGINVFIGANATGKTHLLKLLYSACSSAPKRASDPNVEKLQKRLEAKLTNTFMPDDDRLSRLIRGSEAKSKVDIRWDTAKLGFEIDHAGLLTIEQSNFKDEIRSLFIPSKEVLSMFPGFIAAYSEKELSFDETYYDICVALSGSGLKNKRQDRLTLIDELQKILGGKVDFSGKDFHIKGPSDKKGTEAHLISEGMRKVAMLAHLLGTGGIRRKGILFWDEPESSLNPKFVTKMAQLIRGLAAMDVQVFIATHDYLLTRELSLVSEYKNNPNVNIQFYCFEREDLMSPVSVESGSTLAELKHNPILEEFEAHYGREQKLFFHAADKERKESNIERKDKRDA
jgi:AAA15 family ATPase/GTPase